MNFNVYLDDVLARRLAASAKRLGTPRNALIRKAIADWIGRAGASWPAEVIDWVGDPAFKPFEAARAQLAATATDPLGAPERRSSRKRAGRARRA